MHSFFWAYIEYKICNIFHNFIELIYRYPRAVRAHALANFVGCTRELIVNFDVCFFSREGDRGLTQSDNKFFSIMTFIDLSMWSKVYPDALFFGVLPVQAPRAVTPILHKAFIFLCRHPIPWSHTWEVSQLTKLEISALDMVNVL